MITTSYFASKAPVERKVVISKKYPRFLKKGCLWVPELAPSDPFAQGDWRRRYMGDLEQRFPSGRGLRELLAKIESQISDPILCCFEKDSLECHRSLLAEYASLWAKVLIQEWQP